MIVEDLIPFFQWLPSAALSFLLSSAVLTLLGVLFGYIIASFRHGPVEGFYVVTRVCFGAIPDFLGTSPRRIWAIAKLAIRETIRRRVLLVAFAIFTTLILVGGWFLDTDSDHPERIYIGFLGFGTQLLVVLLGLMISAFSLPTDIANKTIFTVTTKPVRATEIVLGRILGFVIVGTLLLTTIWIVGYLFVMRGLTHQHTMEVASVEAVADGKSISGGRVSVNAKHEGFSSHDKHHQHHVEFFESETGELIPQVVSKKGHTHAAELVAGQTGDRPFDVKLGPPQDNLLARVPIYADKLEFLDREGNRKPTGISVGTEWTYRSYIDGGSQAAAILEFDNVFESRFENLDDVNNSGLPLNLQLEIFRQHKGDIETRVRASIYIQSSTGVYKYETKKPVVGHLKRKNMQFRQFISRENLNAREQMLSTAMKQSKNLRHENLTCLMTLPKMGN